MKYRRSPEIVAAAKELGCSVSHLRRVVVYRERKSESLLRRFREFQKTGVAPVKATASANGKYANSPKRPAPPIELAAAENLLSPHFLKVLDALGLERLIVRFSAGPGSPIWEFPNIGEELGEELQAAKFGYFDSSYYEPGVWTHFFHLFGVAKLGAAVGLLKCSIEKRELLGITYILHGEDGKTLRFYYPPHPPKDQIVQVDLEESES